MPVESRWLVSIECNDSFPWQPRERDRQRIGQGTFEMAIGTSGLRLRIPESPRIQRKGASAY